MNLFLQFQDREGIFDTNFQCFSGQRLDLNNVRTIWNDDRFTYEIIVQILSDQILFTQLCRGVLKDAQNFEAF